MTNNASSPAVEHFDAETLKELRESARVYQKLDLAYLAAGGTIVTALKLNDYRLLEFTAQLWAVVVAFLLLFAVDTFVEQFVFTDWISAKTNSLKRRSIRSIKVALDIQPLLHLFFVGGVIAGVLGYSLGATSVLDEIRARAGIQDATELFIAKKQRPPASVEELIALVPSTSRLHDVLKHEPVRFETDSKGNYRIIFAAKDGVIDTPDDEVVTPTLKLSQILSNVVTTECK